MGRMVIEPQFSSIGWFEDGVCPVQLHEGEKWRLIDRHGSFVSTIQFDEYSDLSLNLFRDGLMRAMVDDKYGFIDKNGNWVIPPTHVFAYDFSEGLAPVRTADDRAGFINKKGEIAIPLQYSWTNAFCHGLAEIEVWNKEKDENENYFINHSGERVWKIEN